MTKVLVATASRHDSTAEIGAVIASSIADAGVQVDACEAAAVRQVAEYDAVVLGSAVYMGGWLHAARDLVDRLGDDLAGKPVWLFSSGPLGDPPQPKDEPVGVATLVARTGAREHRTFAGRLEKSGLGLTERATVKMVHAPYGDYRPWDEIRQWAAGIAADVAGR